MRTRKKHITYAEVDAGLNKYLLSNRLPVISPIEYILQLKRETGLADWKIAKDLAVDSGVEVAVPTVRLWRVRGEQMLAMNPGRDNE